MALPSTTAKSDYYSKSDQEQGYTVLPIAATARARVGVLLGSESVDLGL